MIALAQRDRPIRSSKCVLSGVTETWVRLIRAGIIVVPQDAETSFHNKPAKPRKPAEQRAKIPARVDAWPKGRKLVSRNTLRKAPEPTHD